VIRLERHEVAWLELDVVGDLVVHVLRGREVDELRHIDDELHVNQPGLHCSRQRLHDGAIGLQVASAHQRNA
jgi:hypothetical protein